jgi:imidazolonepropionase-like amidohydrolase
MKGDEVLKDADVVIENNRITRVGAKGIVPSGAKIFDVKGKTITPGFIDTHAHWFEIRRGILDTQNWAFLANLAYGKQLASTCKLEPTYVCVRGSGGYGDILASGIFDRARSFLRQ